MARNARRRSMSTGEYRGQGSDESGKEQNKLLGPHVFGAPLASQFFPSENFQRLQGRA